MQQQNYFSPSVKIKVNNRMVMYIVYVYFVIVKNCLALRF